MPNTVGNLWNAIRYTMYVPIYDVFVSYFNDKRQASINQIEFAGEEKVLIVGAGTGLDFPYLKKAQHITAIDITPAMVQVMKWKTRKATNIQVEVMDAQNLQFENKAFDVVILHLILAVVPDAEKTILEAARVLNDDGTILVFDKFLKPNQKVSLLRKIINGITQFLATSINRDIEMLAKKVKLKIVSRKDAALKGMFQFVVLKKAIIR